MILIPDPLLILFDVLQMARGHISEVLMCSSEAIKVEIKRQDNGGLGFEFTVDPKQVPGVSKDEVQEVVAQIYTRCKAEFELRRRVNAMPREEVLQGLRGDGV